MPSRRHCRQTGPIYLAKLLSLPFLAGRRPALLLLRCGLRPLAGLRPAFKCRPGTGALASQACRYTLLFFGGRHPLCGIGVTSRITRTSIPAVESARTALSRPDPGPDTRTSTERSPVPDALLA